MVFFSSCNSVKFHSELLNYIDIPVKAIHGKQKQVCAGQAGRSAVWGRAWVAAHDRVGSESES